MAVGKASGPFEFEIDGERQFKLSLGRMNRALTDLRPFWDKALRPSFFQITKALFMTGGASGGHGGWQALSPKYAKWKTAHFPGKALMIRSGALMGALLGGSGHVYESHAQWMAIGAGIDYGTLHQRGAGNLPQRRTIDVSKEQEKSVFAPAFGLIARDLGLMWSGKDVRL